MTCWNGHKIQVQVQFWPLWRGQALLNREGFFWGPTSAHWSCDKAVCLLAFRYDPHPEGHRAPEVYVPGATKAGKYGKVQQAEQTLRKSLKFLLKLMLELGELVAKGISVQV